MARLVLICGREEEESHSELKGLFLRGLSWIEGNRGLLTLTVDPLCPFATPADSTLQCAHPQKVWENFSKNA